MLERPKAANIHWGYNERLEEYLAGKDGSKEEKLIDFRLQVKQWIIVKQDWNVLIYPVSCYRKAVNVIDILLLKL